MKNSTKLGLAVAMTAGILVGPAAASSLAEEACVPIKGSEAYTETLTSGDTQTTDWVTEKPAGDGWVKIDERKVVDVEAVPAVPEVSHIEVVVVTPAIPAVPGVPGVPAVEEVSHTEYLWQKQVRVEKLQHEIEKQVKGTRTKGNQSQAFDYIDYPEAGPVWDDGRDRTGPHNDIFTVSGQPGWQYHSTAYKYVETGNTRSYNPKQYGAWGNEGSAVQSVNAPGADTATVRWIKGDPIKVIDVAYVPAVPAIPAIPGVPAVTVDVKVIDTPAVPAVEEESHQEYKFERVVVTSVTIEHAAVPAKDCPAPPAPPVIPNCDALYPLTNIPLGSAFYFDRNDRDKDGVACEEKVAITPLPHTGNTATGWIAGGGAAAVLIGGGLWYWAASRKEETLG